ncbi:UDP-N-acetylmuramate--L-alanine ligase [Philodulcilactobacillus myokoensis]|uniref:UDP-N-acetylmuramate--L-alanine ligase n=1 Tax=Philodulcilactobacillus myokoensis TaxID=2929573 RepID=A0A9W6B0H6_9LACO|nr:UDP-N-acetylmuramate--L-alanine ligase [Philodulcilactobacillus myokoensis]GLB46744.1 UDP-N-acetylmuramate--L-alanine ligase [Philodulcilactobacillus myokoensis]
MNKNTIYHFVGIKGTGMSAMALILHARGCKVQGSDIEQRTFTQKGLENAHIKLLPFDPKNIHEGLTVIAGNSFTNDHPEIAKALKMKLPVYRYHQFLGKMIEGHTSIGISGTHGKTSTTGLLSHVLSNIAPTDYLIGDGTGNGVPNARFFVYEADEYRRHFLATKPDYSIMTNVDFDHPDYYADINDVFSAFQSFADQTQKGVFVWGEDPRLKHLKTHVPVYTYGTGLDDDFRAVNVKRNTDGSEFDVVHDGKNLGRFVIHLFGEHSILNSLAVIAVSYFEDVDLKEIKRELANFMGVKRRFSRSKVSDMTIVDDYAHHPSEINATLDATRQEFPDKKVVVVFQPHTYSRTLAYLDQFAQSLSKADEVYVTKIYSSPREKSGKVSSQDLVNKITKNSHLIKGEDMKPLLQYHNEVVVFMGAGDIQKYEKKYKDLLQKR